MNMTAAEAERAHAAEMARVQAPGGPESDVVNCEARIAAAAAELKALEGTRSDVRISYARGAATAEEFDQADRTVETMQRRWAALNDSLPSLKRTVTEAYGGLHKYARIIEDATVAESLARREARQKDTDLKGGGK